MCESPDAPENLPDEAPCQVLVGRFEAADGGTMFLDEIGELPLEIQSVLLRVLRERECERVGSSHSILVNVRGLAASNRDFKLAAAAGTFRQDLFYRLNAFPIQIPAPRDRVADIPLLVQYLIDCAMREARGKGSGRSKAGR